MNWYNEIDAYAAEWLENLMLDGLIPAGVVDRRPIEDVSPDDLIGFDQCHFFAGIGGWPLALNLAGWGESECWTGSCPCQPFSAAGKRKGVDDARHLWPEFRRLIAAHRPSVIFGEQVASSDGRAWFGGQPGLQRVQDREAIIGVLQGRDLPGRLPDTLQAMLLCGRGGAQISHTEGEEERRLQEVAAAEPRGCSGSAGASSCEGEGVALHAGPEGGSGGDRFRGVPDDGGTVQPGRGPNVGQPFSGQNRQLEGLCPGECSRGALLHQRDGEHMGREQDRGDRGSDHGAAAECVSVFAGEAGIRVEATAEFRELAGVRADLEALGYACGGADLCAAGVGAPHIRQRLWWVADSGGFCIGTGRLETGRAVVETEPGSEGSVGGGGVGDADQSGLSQRERDGRVQRETVGSQPGQAAVGGSNPGFWSGFDLIPCADGKARRVEPGTFPLAHGVSARVGKLRAYGNAIVPPLAAEFIRACIEGDVRLT